jgi:hypothetical protein
VKSSSSTGTGTPGLNIHGSDVNFPVAYGPNDGFFYGCNNEGLPFGPAIAMYYRPDANAVTPQDRARI